MKRTWRVLVPGLKPFLMIGPTDRQDALTIARGIWPSAELE